MPPMQLKMKVQSLSCCIVCLGHCSLQTRVSACFNEMSLWASMKLEESCHVKQGGPVELDRWQAYLGISSLHPSRDCHSRRLNHNASVSAA